MNTFQDIIKRSFQQKIDALDLTQILIVLGITSVMGILLAVIYKKTFRGMIYTPGFGLSLALISLITSMVILTISSNIVLSLGMVGALSIVRFRTAIKDSRDIVFLFWAIAVGVANGASLFLVSGIGSLFILGLLACATLFETRTFSYLLVLSYGSQADPAVQEKLREFKKLRVQSRIVNASGVELTLSLSLKDGETGKTDAFRKIAGVEKVTLIGYSGEGSVP